MRIIRSALLPILLAAPLAAAAQSSGLWNYHFNQGIGEYSTGAWDSPTGGALAISCGSDGRISIGVQIKGKAPPPSSRVTMMATSRIVARPAAFTADSRGSIAIPSRADPEFRRLWANLRWGDTVVLRYADGRSTVQSLAGAAKTLPAEPCG